MQAEELMEIINELDVNNSDKFRIKRILSTAYGEYVFSDGNLRPTLKFTVHGWFIEQTAVLGKLGISVAPFNPKSGAYTEVSMQSKIITGTKEDVLRYVKKNLK